MSGLLLGEWITPIHLRPCKGLIRKYKNAKIRKRKKPPELLRRPFSSFRIQDSGFRFQVP